MSVGFASQQRPKRKGAAVMLLTTAEMASVSATVLRAATVLSASGPLSPGEVVVDRGMVVEARSTFTIRTIRSRGPLPLDHWR